MQNKDKNAAVWGVKVGMKRAAALKKLQKACGKQYVVQTKKGQSYGIDKNGKSVASGKAKGTAYTTIWVSGGENMPVEFGLKNGKVSYISWERMS